MEWQDANHVGHYIATRQDALQHLSEKTAQSWSVCAAHLEQPHHQNITNSQVNQCSNSYFILSFAKRQYDQGETPPPPKKSKANSKNLDRFVTKYIPQ